MPDWQRHGRAQFSIFGDIQRGAAVDTYGGRDGRPKSREIKLTSTGPDSELEKAKSALLAQQRAGPGLKKTISAYVL